MEASSQDENHQILVVEDDLDIREAIASALECEGYQVATAANGQEALDWMRTSSPCIVLLDLMMPVMNGWELLQHMKRDVGKLASTPVCVMSAWADRAPAEADAVLPKPLSIKALLDVIRQRC